MFFKVIFAWKYIKVIYYYYFLKFIFNINVLKRSTKKEENLKINIKAFQKDVPLHSQIQLGVHIFNGTVKRFGAEFYRDSSQLNP